LVPAGISTSLGVAAGGEKIAAVDHRRRHIGVTDLRAGAWPPGRSGLGLEQVGSIVAHECEGVAALQQRDAFGDETFELAAFYLGAVLLLLSFITRTRRNVISPARPTIDDPWVRTRNA
jgi:hypothetical protein